MPAVPKAGEPPASTGPEPGEGAVPHPAADPAGDRNPIRPSNCGVIDDMSTSTGRQGPVRKDRRALIGLVAVVCLVTVGGPAWGRRGEARTCLRP